MSIEALTLSQLSGPLGGTLAVTWAAGAASGYYFAMKSLKEKVAFLGKQIKMADQTCEIRMKNLDEQYKSEIETLKEILDAQGCQLRSMQQSFIQKYE